MIQRGETRDRAERSAPPTVEKENLPPGKIVDVTSGYTQNPGCAVAINGDFSTVGVALVGVALNRKIFACTFFRIVVGCVTIAGEAIGGWILEHVRSGIEFGGFKKWIGGIVIAVVLGEAIWAFLVSITINLALPAMARVMGGDAQSPLYLGKGDFNVQALFTSFLELCLLGSWRFF